MTANSDSSPELDHLIACIIDYRKYHSEEYLERFRAARRAVLAKMNPSQPQGEASEPAERESAEPSNCIGCGTKLENAPGIGPYCPNKGCDRVDDQTRPEPSHPTGPTGPNQETP